MTRGVRKYLVGSVVLVGLIAVAGCSHYLMAVRQPWRDEAETACINSGVPGEIPGRVRISTISGSGACGIEYPLKVSELGESSPPIAYGGWPQGRGGPDTTGAIRRQWPAVQSSPLPPPQGIAAAGGQNSDGPPQDAEASRYDPPATVPVRDPSPYQAPAAGAPMSLTPAEDVAPPEGDLDGNLDDFGGPPHPYYGGPNPPRAPPQPAYTPRPLQPPADITPAAYPPAPPGEGPIAEAGPVQLKPAATLACPIVSALDKWVAGVVQPAALRWFHQPVVEIKQIGSYSCRDMINGNPNAPISEHAFGNALDIAGFVLADGHQISVQYGWHGTPEEQGFLHDVQGGACRDFTTVLAPGANVYHYNHIHVDLMRRKYRPYICEPRAIPGDVAAARARARAYAARHDGPNVTGSIGANVASRHFGADTDHWPLAVPGND
jgi:hypothetical protein